MIISSSTSGLSAANGKIQSTFEVNKIHTLLWEYEGIYLQSSEDWDWIMCEKQRLRSQWRTSENTMRLAFYLERSRRGGAIKRVDKGTLRVTELHIGMEALLNSLEQAGQISPKAAFKMHKPSWKFYQS